MKVVGLDLGTKRIGVAISDALSITAQGLTTLQAEDEKKMMTLLKEILDTEGVAEIVIGLPLNMDGTQGPQALKAKQFSCTLKEKFKIPVKLWDERLSTMEVSRIMINAGVSRMKRKKKIDKLAAQVMLQSYLNAQSQTTGN